MQQNLFRSTNIVNNICKRKRKTCGTDSKLYSYWEIDLVTTFLYDKWWFLKNHLTKSNTACELVDGWFGHAVGKYTRKLTDRKMCKHHRQSTRAYTNKTMSNYFVFIWFIAHMVLMYKFIKLTDRCPFTLDTFTIEPLVLIRCGTQRWVRWYTDLKEKKMFDFENVLINSKIYIFKLFYCRG